MLFAALPSSTAGESVELKIQAYLWALADFSADAVTEAVKDVLRGEAGLNNHFMPTPPELAQVCRVREARRMAELSRLRRPSAPADPAWHPTPEEGARMAAKADAAIAALNRTMAGDELRKQTAEGVSAVLRRIADEARRRA